MSQGAAQGRCVAVKLKLRRCELLIGIDPGKGGGVAWKCNGHREHANVVAMPETEGDMLALWRRLVSEAGEEEIILYHEKLTGFAGGMGNPGSTMFTMAKYYWPWIFLAMYCGYRVEGATPQKWIKYLGLGKKDSKKGKDKKQCYEIDKAWKNKLKAEAQRLFPMVNVTLKTSDALLVLEYGIRNNNQQKGFLENGTN